MSILCNSAVISGESAVDTGDIGHSLRFRRSASANLSRTFSAGDQKTWLWAGFVKPCDLITDHQGLLKFGSSYVGLTTYGGVFRLWLNYQAVWSGHTEGVVRDPTSHIHVMFKHDTTQAVAADRFKVWFNGVQQTFTVDGGSMPAQNADGIFNQADVHEIGRGSAAYIDAYLSRVCFVGGSSATALTPTSFIQFNTEINEWVSKSQSAVKAVVDAGGTNSFMLDFDDATSLTTLGYDKSSKGNNWTLNNFSLTAGPNYDHMLDVPGNSFATLNPIAPNTSLTASTCTDGNLVASASAANTIRKCTVGFSTGKWYGEAGLTTTVQLFGLGEAAVNSFGTNSSTVGARTYYLYNSSSLYSILPGADTGLISGLATGGRLAFACDMDNRKLWLGYAASGGSVITWVGGGDPAAGTSPTHSFASDVGTLFPLLGTNEPSLYAMFGQAPLHASATYHSDAGGYFRYAPPTGYKALCQRNLPDISPATLLDPSDHHVDITVTKSGDTNFTLPWDASVYDTFFEIKRRNASGDWYQIDGLRGYDKILKSNSTAAETTDANVLGVSGTTCTLKSTLADGTYIISATKAGLSASRQTNTDGSITSTVSRNVDSGFSIVSWTGTAANGTVGHGLGVAPKIMVLANRNITHDTIVWHDVFSATERIYLNLTNAKDTGAATSFNSTRPSSTVISLGSNAYTNGAGDTGMVAYCYADSAIQKSFSYTGKGSADGAYADLGFKPGRVLLKCSSTTGNWTVLDSTRSAENVADDVLYENLTNAEATSALADLNSRGIKFRITTDPNSAQTFIGHAWAVVTGKYSLAR